MNAKWKLCLGAGLAAAIMMSGAGMASAQGAGQYPPPAQQEKKPATEPLTLDGATPPAPVNAEEDAAFKAFTDIPGTDTQKKIESGEAFLQKYPQSRYRPAVLSPLVVTYVKVGQVDKMETAGDKEIELSPTDLGTLAIVASTLPRAINPGTPEPDKKLAKAERYAKQAIDVAPTLPKPDTITDEQFARAKNEYLAMAHSGLGLVYFRRGKYAEAIPELDQSTKLDPAPDPVNFYLLAVSNQRASHFDDAVAAYTKCAAIPGSLQATCKSGIDEAKKLGATELSAPK
jgi:tetratricopeptide (TPR) repeat protein